MTLFPNVAPRQFILRVCSQDGLSYASEEELWPCLLDYYQTLFFLILALLPALLQRLSVAWLCFASLV